jgi:His/Glu/Gln/Arg/opine family amino acid ABC transporter permease subunit
MNFDHALFILQGTLVNVTYALLAGSLAFFISFFLLFSPFKYFKLAYLSIFRGTPLLVQLSFFYFVLPQVLSIHLSVFTSGIICLTLNSTAYMLASLESILKSIDTSQILAAQTLQMTNKEIKRYIIFPQVLKTGLSSLGNEWINLIKESSILSFIGEMDLIRRFQLVSSETYSYLEPLFVTGFCFYITILFFSLFLNFFEKKYLC